MWSYLSTPVVGVRCVVSSGEYTGGGLWIGEAYPRGASGGGLWIGDPCSRTRLGVGVSAAGTLALALMYSEGREMGRSSTWLMLAGAGSSGGIEVCRSCGDFCGLNDCLEGDGVCFANLSSTAAGLERSFALFVVLLTRLLMLLILSCKSTRALCTLSARCTRKQRVSLGRWRAHQTSQDERQTQRRHTCLIRSAASSDFCFVASPSCRSSEDTWSCDGMVGSASVPSLGSGSAAPVAFECAGGSGGTGGGTLRCGGGAALRWTRCGNKRRGLGRSAGGAQSEGRRGAGAHVGRSLQRAAFRLYGLRRAARPWQQLWRGRVARRGLTLAVRPRPLQAQQARRGRRVGGGGAGLRALPAVADTPSTVSDTPHRAQ